MRKRYVSVGLAVAFLGLVVGGLSLTAGAASNGSKLKSWQYNPFSSRAVALPASHQSGQTIVVRTEQTHNTNVDVDGNGQGPGDYFVFRDKVYNRHHVRLGRDNGQCTINFPVNENRFSIDCEVAFHFTGATTAIRSGNIMVEGNLLFSATTTNIAVPITGGSGHYQNVRGEVHVGAGNKIIFHLLP